MTLGLAGGWQRVTQSARLVFLTYLVQLGFAVTLWLGAFGSLLAVFGRRPIWDEVMRGDLAALFMALREHGDLVAGLTMTGLGLALVYWIASLFLTAGLLGAFAGRRFGPECMRAAWPFVRLSLWAMFPYLAAGLVLGVGFRVAPPDRYPLELSRWLGQIALAAGPGLLVLWLTAASVDMARADLVVHRGRAAWRSFIAGWRLVLTTPGPLVLGALFGLGWFAVTALYVAATWGRPLAGVGGALLLLFVRQAVAAARFVLHATLLASQTELSVRP